MVPAGFGLPANGFEGGLSESARQLFQSFWELFSAERLRERAIFWVDSQKGQLVLRHVRDIRRQRRIQDHLVTRVPHDQDLVRIAIGNFAEGCNTTPIRWELYSDFELTQQIDYGRFDHRDLLPEFADPKELMTRSVHPVGDWDFDNILLTHKCVYCRGIFNPESVIYTQRERCSRCDKSPDHLEAKLMIQKMLGKYARRFQVISTHRVNEETNEFPLQGFIDPTANAVLYWWVLNVGARSLASGDLGDNYKPFLELLHQGSLFNAMTVQWLRDRLEEHLYKIDGTNDRYRWSVFLSQVSKWSRVLDGNETSDAIFGTDRTFVEQILPDFINRVILSHVADQQMKSVTPVVRG